MIFHHDTLNHFWSTYSLLFMGNTIRISVRFTIYTFPQFCATTYITSYKSAVVQCAVLF